MNYYLKRVIVITFKVIVRVAAVVGVMLLLSLLLKFSASMHSLEENVVFLGDDSVEVCYVDMDDVETKGVDEGDVDGKTNVKESTGNDGYVVASSDSADEYPDGWLESFNSRIIELQKIFPKGMYWNHMGCEPGSVDEMYSVTDIPCNHSLYGEVYCNSHHGKSDEAYPYRATSIQCWGFGSLLSDLVFGEDAPVYRFENYDDIRIGDQARIGYDYHTVFIIDKTDEYVVVAECNADLETCQINWGRKIMREDLVGWYMTRWER